MLACAIVELTNDRDHFLWHAKTGEYCPEEGSINGVVRFGKVDKAYIRENIRGLYTIMVSFSTLLVYTVDPTCIVWSHI